MNVVKCSKCERYIETEGESYYQLWEFIKGTRKKQCVLNLCYKCKGEASPKKEE